MYLYGFSKCFELWSLPNQLFGTRHRTSRRYCDISGLVNGDTIICTPLYTISRWVTAQFCSFFCLKHQVSTISPSTWPLPLCQSSAADRSKLVAEPPGANDIQATDQRGDGNPSGYSHNWFCCGNSPCVFRFCLRSCTNLATTWDGFVRLDGKHGVM